MMERQSLSGDPSARNGDKCYDLTEPGNIEIEPSADQIAEELNWCELSWGHVQDEIWLNPLK